MNSWLVLLLSTVTGLYSLTTLVFIKEGQYGFALMYFGYVVALIGTLMAIRGI